MKEIRKVWFDMASKSEKPLIARCPSGLAKSISRKEIVSTVRTSWERIPRRAGAVMLHN